MRKWEEILDSLHREGWGYGYAKCLDVQTGDEVYLVNINRNGERLTTVKPTLDEAVNALSQLLQAKTTLKLEAG